ncbi:hypothetical protein Pint_07719 [Pistacia integerrima]|uniref:Uncharacterized protein n=1 Tax=Pistacia integerrima TaxID=434235 RepID=A0ACC0XWZ0_9ROSI|nr:hypothetical protein Pint_07719 [Pistacia integerrima]
MDRNQIKKATLYTNKKTADVKYVRVFHPPKPSDQGNFGEPAVTTKWVRRPEAEGRVAWGVLAFALLVNNLLSPVRVSITTVLTPPLAGVLREVVVMKNG